MGKRILLADDSITIQKVIELTFSDEDFEVVTVGNGRLAIEKVEEVRPDIVLCDIIMPEKDGYEVCEYVKRHPSLAGVPVLLLTGAFEPFDQERAARVGCDGFLAKPFEPAMLIGKVKELLAHAASRSAAPAPQPPAAAPAPAPVIPAVSAFPPPPPEPVTFPLEHPSAVYEAEPDIEEPLPSASSSFIPDEPLIEELPEAASFETSPAAPDEGIAASVLEQEFYGANEPVETAPEDFMPVTAEEAETLSSDTTDSSTVIFRAGEVSWAQPTMEVPLEARAKASVEALEANEAQAPPAPAPTLDEVFEEDLPAPPAPAFPEPIEDEPEAAAPYEAAAAFAAAAPVAATAPVAFDVSVPSTGAVPPPPPTPPVAPPGVPEVAFEPALAPEEQPDLEPGEPAMPGASAVPEPAAVPVPDLAEAVSFADVAPPVQVAPPPASEAAPSAAAEVTVPVDMVAQIAQRVVAQVSEKVVREVAWEVIPELAEALIKKEIERLKAELQNT
jgi:CheY-like chemotaxis protein